MSESHGQYESNRDLPWVQRPEPRRPSGAPPTQRIEPGQAAEFRRRLDYQGSAELIPTAGPDAASEQGPAIKAVWEPSPPNSAAARRQSRRSGHGDGRPGARKKRRGTLVIGGLATVAVAAVGVVGLSGGGDKQGPVKGSAATFLPDASSAASADTSQSSSGSNGTNVSLTTSGSPTAKPTTSASASPSLSASPSKSAAAGGSSSSATPTAPATSPKSSKSPKPPHNSPSPTHTSCFLFICN